MRVKEIDRTANIAWSPQAQHPIYIAAGTAAQQLDATFSTSAALEIYTLDLSEPGLEMDIAGSMPSELRFHKLVWGSHGMTSGEYPSGVLIGGADNGNLFVMNPANIVKKEEPISKKLIKHTGAVQALDLNPFQTNLLASGGSDSEIFLWDLNAPGSPMTPGTKSQPPDDVTCLAWNQQVQHILASTYAGRCVVWDLRKNEPIIKVSDSMSRIKCKLVAWHPDVATQLCLSSEDDHTPVIQLWDLRFATSPLKQLENHTRGVLSMAWCAQDPDLLLSCGKDNRILCWNPNSSVQAGEVVYELPTSNQWSFDVQWCPRNPSIISSCSFDSHVAVYSLMGGGPPPAPSSRVADAFQSEPFGAQPAPQPQVPKQEAPVVVLKKPPKWMRRPVGASFAFGGKLVTFENCKASAPQQQQQPQQRLVYTSQVVTETELVNRSHQLEQALNNNQLSEYCNMKVANSKSDEDENIWSFLRVHFEKDPRSRYLQLLGYDHHDLTRKVSTSDVDDLSSRVTSSSLGGAAGAQQEGENDVTVEESTADQFAEGDAGSAFDSIARQDRDPARSDSPLPFDTSDDCDGLVTQAVLTANFESAVEVCLRNDRMAEAILLAIAGGAELLAKTQKKFFSKNQSNLNRLLASVVTRDFETVVRTCALDNWREALALCITYSKPEEFTKLCDILGSRLESERKGQLAANACLCYICAGNVQRLLVCWNRLHPAETSAALQDMVEKVMTLQKAKDLAAGKIQDVDNPLLAEKLSRYAELLAAQGALHTALGYLGNSNEVSLAFLRDRLYTTLGAGSPGMPAKPFQVHNVQPQRAAAAQPQAAAVASQARAQNRASNYYQTQAGSFQTTTSPSPMGGYTAPATSLHSGAHAQPASVQNYQQPAVSAASRRSRYPSTGGYQGQPAAPDIYNPYNPAAAVAPAMAPAVPYSAAPGPAGMAPAPANAGYGPQQPTPANSWRRQSNHSTDSEIAGGGPTDTPPTYQDVKPQRAWNDPPPVSNKPATTSAYEAPTPIQQPIYNPAMMQPEQPAPGGPQQFSNVYNPGQYQPAAAAAMPPAEPTPPPQPVQKGPIPAEHVVLQEVLEKLAKLCLERSGNPQMKRKLEDVLRKLEILYDKLRSNALSTNVLSGLHMIIQCIQCYDYQNGLLYHTQLISQGNFSEISQFMPAIKTVLQTAAQLQVFVQ